MLTNKQEGRRGKTQYREEISGVRKMRRELRIKGEEKGCDNRCIHALRYLTTCQVSTSKIAVN